MRFGEEFLTHRRRGTQGFRTTAAPSATYDHIVSTTGNDIAGTGTVLNPWRTWAKARSVAVAGQTVGYRGGTYAETLEWFGGNSGTSYANGITFKAYEGEPVTVQPSAADFALVMRGTAAGANNGPQYLIFDGVTFDGRNCAHDVIKVTAWDPTTSSSSFPNADSPASFIRFIRCRSTSQRGLGHTQQGFMITFGSTVEIIDSEVDNVGDNAASPNSQGVYGAASDLLLDNVYFHDIDGYGYSGGSSYVGQVANNQTIRDCTAYLCGKSSSALGGFNMGQGTGHVFSNCIAWDCLGRGFAAAFFDGSGIKFYHCTAVGSASDGFHADGSQINAEFINCIAYNNGTNYADSGSGTVQTNNWNFGGTNTNPNFVGPITGTAANFRLTGSSSATLRSGGLLLAAVPQDKDGVDYLNPPSLGTYQYS